jgi:hypothetical protein
VTFSELVTKDELKLVCDGMVGTRKFPEFVNSADRFPLFYTVEQLCWLFVVVSSLSRLKFVVPEKFEVFVGY